MTRLLSLLLCFVLLGSAGVIAAEADLPRPDPPGKWWRITKDEATTDSKCIGQLTSPLCAVETERACFSRQNKELCRLAEINFRAEWLFDFKSRRDSVTLYRVVRSFVLGEGDIPGWARLLCENSWRPGDVAIDLEEKYCWREADNIHCGVKQAARPIFRREVVRRLEDGQWKLMGDAGTEPPHLLWNGTCYE